MKRVGIIGCGNIFGTHYESLKALDDVEIAALCDIDSAKTTALEAKFNLPVFTDYKQMITEIKPDVVHILTPHFLHAQMCIYALEAGCDVITEKPMSIALADAEKMAETAEKTKKRLGVIFQNRFNPGSVLLKENLGNGSLGKIEGARCEVCWHRDDDYYASGEWRGKFATEGGGVLINQAIHTLDLMRWLIGGETEALSASVAHRGKNRVEVEDTAEGLITFSGGVQGCFYFTNNNSYDAPTLLELKCENGVAKLSGAKGIIDYSDGRRLEADEDESVCMIGKNCWGNSHFRQIRAFYEDDAGEYWKYSVSEALKTQKLMCNIYKVSGR